MDTSEGLRVDSEAGQNEDVADGDDFLDIVRQAWGSVLGRTDFTDDENFFRGGGHSLRATRLTTSLSRTTGVRIPVRFVFEHPTVRELSVAVARHIRFTAPQEQGPHAK